VNSVYLNGNFKDSSATGTVVLCVALSVTLKSTAPKNVFYINGNYGKDYYYLIQCTEIVKCKLYVSKEFKKDKITASTKKYYMHGASSANCVNVIIEVTFKDGGKLALTASPFIIASPAVETIYINSAIGKLIQCTSSSCDGYAGAGEEKKPYYYINAAAGEANENYTDAIIKWNDTKCEFQAGEANGIYLNGNLKDSKTNKNSNDNNQLIVYSEGLCSGKSSELSAKGYEFFINSGDYNDGIIDYPLIKCTYNSADTCVADKVNMDSAIKLFYININYNKNAIKKRDINNYLIQCISATEYKVYKNNSLEAEKEHFVHGTANKLTDAIIECSLTAASSKPDDINNESDKLTNVLIKCILDESTNKKVCAFFTGKPDFINIDNYTKGNIIYCTSNNACKSKVTFTEKEKNTLQKFKKILCK